jgi:hypothetical protein
MIRAGDDLHGNVPGDGVALQPVEHCETGVIGQFHVENDGRRTELQSKLHALVCRGPDQAVEANLVREVI